MVPKYYDNIVYKYIPWFCEIWVRLITKYVIQEKCL